MATTRNLVERRSVRPQIATTYTQCHSFNLQLATYTTADEVSIHHSKFEEALASPAPMLVMAIEARPE